MPTKIIETLNGPAVLIPEELLAASKFNIGDAVNIYAQNGKLVIADPSVPHYTIEELMAGVTDENIHGEIDWGPPVGKEVW